MKRLLLLLLLIPAVSAQIDNPFIVSSLDLSIDYNGEVNVTSPSALSSLDLTLRSYPKEDYYSTINELSTQEGQIKDDTIEFNWKNPNQKQLVYSVSSKISLNYEIIEITEKIEFPFQVDKNKFQQYLQKDKKIDPTNSKIRQIANELAEGESDTLVLLTKIGEYSNNYIDYDISYVGKIPKISEILRDRKGVCVEYANLFMSITRALGIPTRYVTGYAYGTVYGNDFSNFPHAWTEVYLPDIGWIPFDPTFGEYGWVDATHFKTQINDGLEVPAVSVKYSGSEVEADLPDADIVVSNVQHNIQNKIETKLYLQEDEPNFESNNIIWMSLKNPQNYYIHTVAFLVTAPEIEGDSSQSVLLKPGEERIIGWKIKPQSNLDKDFKYFHNITVRAVAGSQKTVSLTLNPKSGTSLSLTEATNLLSESEKKEISEITPKVRLTYATTEKVRSGNNKIVMNLRNIGLKQTNNVNVCLEEQCHSSNLGINEETDLIFISDLEVGNNTLLFDMEGSEIEESQELFTIEAKSSNIFIIFIEFLRSLF